LLNCILAQTNGKIIYIPPETAGKKLKLHSEKLRPDLCSSPRIVKAIKSRRMRWAEHVTLMGEVRNTYRISVGKPEKGTAYIVG
jgi:hypothetical protein